ncbi:MAG: IS1634 family transposase [Actinomycetota bacterium]|nr:IS1634 family transposase [Actinomycetota bacterium]
MKQLVWILTVAADGAVPLCHRVADGNTEDSTTHVATWDALCQLLGRSDFLYVADSKLCVRATMAHIGRLGGRFVTVLPRSRKEDGAMRDWLVTHEPAWREALVLPGRRGDDTPDVYSIVESPWPSAEGYRVIWVRSSAKVARDEEARRVRIAAGIAAMDAINVRLSSSRTRLTSKVTIAKEADEDLEECGATRWVSYEIEEVTEVRHRQESRGRPGKSTRYRRIEKIRHRLRFSVREDVVAHDACSDGCWPLVTNVGDLDAVELLVAYKYQPHLERRHHLLKGDQLVAPVFLQDPARIEGLMTCHFIALLLQALMELEVRREMARRGIEALALYPEERPSTAPSAARMIEAFTGVARHRLFDADGNLVQTFAPVLTPLQEELLDLLGVSPSAYS